MSGAETVVLKPCPFCGGEAELTGYRAPEFWVHCPQIGCKASTEAFGSKERAIAAWNTRATQADALAVMREAIELLEQGKHDAALLAIRTYESAANA
jgi:hypothetical protein